ncbi:MAG TPA: hypothetical protein VG297_12515 [Bryobacteraceae bacterium]|jgi:hypothetical protein|nr:hypothetical protein [Bryobacteraceae bacterium]
MRRITPVLLCLILLLGGLCGGLCLAQTSAAHSCCHHQNDDCGHGAPSMQSHQVIATPQIGPAILAAPALPTAMPYTSSRTPVPSRSIAFVAVLRPVVLRL